MTHNAEKLHAPRSRCGHVTFLSESVVREWADGCVVKDFRKNEFYVNGVIHDETGLHHPGDC